MKTAQEACEKHKRLWTKACEATGIRGLVEIFGKLPTAYPVWARKKLPRKVLEVLTRPPNLVCDDDEEVEACPTPEPTLPAGGEPSRSDPINISPTLFKSTAADNPQESTPVSPAEGGEPSTTRKTRRARSKATEAVETSPAPPAEATAQGTQEACRKAYKEAIARFHAEAHEYKALVQSPQRSPRRPHEKANPSPPRARRMKKPQLTAEQSARLEELRACIKREAPFVGKKPYSHNIIRFNLAIIASEFGGEEANRAVRNFRLKSKGFNEEPIQWQRRVPPNARPRSTPSKRKSDEAGTQPGQVPTGQGDPGTVRRQAAAHRAANRAVFRTPTNADSLN